MLAIALALGAAVSWGFADFFAGIQAKRHPILTILLIGQTVGLLALAVVVAARAAELPGTTALIAAALGGLAGTAGLACFYKALSMGQISLVTPIAAIGVVVPVVAGIVRGERPGPAQLAGIVLAICGVVIASREHHEPEKGAAGIRATVLVALGSALFLGLGIVGLDVGADDDPYWTILIFRSVTVVLVIAIVLALRHRPSPGRSDSRIIALIGILDIAGFTLLALATTEGLLSIVVVLASLYPVIAIALAHHRLGERLRSVQRVGVVIAMLGVLLIAAGS